MNMKFSVLRNVEMCILIASTNVADQSAASIFCSTRTIEEYCPSLKMEATCSSETLMGALLLDYNV
jgi:hypothetical protein